MSSLYDDWVMRLALTQRTHEPCVPTTVTRPGSPHESHTRDICGIYDVRGVAYVQK